MHDGRPLNWIIPDSTQATYSRSLTVMVQNVRKPHMRPIDFKKDDCSSYHFVPGTVPAGASMPPVRM
jgi:hypothetical protein